MVGALEVGNSNNIIVRGSVVHLALSTLTSSYKVWDLEVVTVDTHNFDAEILGLWRMQVIWNGMLAVSSRSRNLGLGTLTIKVVTNL